MKDIYMPLGLPGIGKSTYVNGLLNGRAHTYIGSDAIRKEITGDESNLSRDIDMWRTYNDRFEKALKSNAPDTAAIVLDSTFLTTKKRAGYFDMMRNAVAQGQTITVHILEFPLNVKLALERQKTRERKVPEQVIRNMAKAYNPFDLKEAQGVSAEHVKIAEDGSSTSTRAA